MASIEPEPSNEPESEPFASYYMTPEQIQAHEKTEANRWEQELSKQMASVRGDLTVSKAAALAGLSTAATAASMADAFDAATLFGSPADALLVAEAKAIGIDVDKIPAGTLRGLGTGGLFALKQRQDHEKLVASVRGDLTASAGISSAMAGLTSTASAASAMADAFGSISASASISDAMAAIARHGTGVESVGVRAMKQEQELSKQMARPWGDQAVSTAAALAAQSPTASAYSALVDTVGAASSFAGYQTCADYAAEAQLLEKARLLGIDVGKMPPHDLHTLGADGLIKVWQEQELSKQMASLRGDLSTSAGISSAMAGLTSTASAASAVVDVFGSVSAAASISDAVDAIARHSSGFESAWLSVHTGGVDQYTKELAHLIQPLASIREAIGTWDGVLATQFDHLACTSTYLQASGVEVGALLKFAWEPANSDAEPNVIAGRFLRTLEDGDGYTEIIPIQVPVRFQPLVQPTGVEQRVAELEVDNAEMRAELAEVKAALARAQATIDVVVSRLPEPTSPPVALAGAEVLQTAKAPVPRQAAQEVAILRAIRAAGNDPKRLPIHAPGKSGIKAAVRIAVQDGKGMFAGSKVFEKAWERLRKTGEISDA